MNANSVARPVLFAFAVLAAAALLLFALILWAEGALDLVRDPSGWMDRLRADAAADMLSNTAEVVAGVLAIAITVVAIVVELAANRYTHRITQLFVREPLNIGVMTLFVITTVQCLWVGGTFGGGLPEGRAFTYTGVIVVMGLATVCLLVLLPYFGYVFNFLSPPNVIAHLRDGALRAIERTTPQDAERRRAEVLEAIDELEDVARGAMSHGDRGIGMTAVGALGDLILAYAGERDRLPDAWFEIDDVVASDPDFVSLADSSVAEIRAQRSWLEYKVLRQLHGLYQSGLGASRDLCDRIAVEAYRIGAQAVRNADSGSALNAIRAFNSFLRAAIRAGDLRSAYFALDQYRSLGEVAIDRGDGPRTLEIADHLMAYGEFAQELGQHFLLEVVAYDLVQLIERAEPEGSLQKALLERLLSVDEVAEGEESGGKLRGVRRAQVQLGVFFLAQGNTEAAATIQRDMAAESPVLLREIRAELEAERRDQYWEFTDRGVNFSYLDDERRAQLGPFLDGVRQGPGMGPRS